MKVRRMTALLPRLTPRLAASCAALALLAGCASHPVTRTAYTNYSSSNPYANEDTAYYLDHARDYYPQPGPASDPWGPYIHEAAVRFDVPAMWIRQVMRVETGGREYSYNHRLTVSGAGAMGLMQLEPGTYQEMEIRYGLSNDPFDPRNNIMAGAAYIHEMYQIYGSPGFLAAYNAGPGRLDSYINYHRPLPLQTVTYVAMIAPNIDGYYPRHRSAADELALNTEPMGDDGGLLPRGFVPIAPTSEQLSSPVEVASLAPVQVPQQPEAPVSVPVSSIMPQVAQIEAAEAPHPASAPVQEAALPVPTPAPASVQEAALPAPTPVPAHVQDAALPVPNPSLLFAHPTPAPAPAPAFAPQPVARPVYNRHYLSLPPPAAIVQVAATPGFNSGNGSWGIQVGAFDTPTDARVALGLAARSGAASLSGARQLVMPVNVHGGIEYRARFVGLQHEAAENACSRLTGVRAGCVLLPPV